MVPPLPIACNLCKSHSHNMEHLYAVPSSARRMRCNAAERRLASICHAHELMESGTDVVEHHR